MNIITAYELSKIDVRQIIIYLRKSIVERITYSKTKRLNWRKSDEDDMEIHLELKI